MTIDWAINFGDILTMVLMFASIVTLCGTMVRMGQRILDENKAAHDGFVKHIESHCERLKVLEEFIRTLANKSL